MCLGMLLRLQLLYIYCIYKVGMSLPHAGDMSPLTDHHGTRTHCNNATACSYLMIGTALVKIAGACSLL